MSNPNKRKGNQFAQDVATYLGVERRVDGGSKDRGDIAGFRFAGQEMVIECKAERAIDLAGSLTEACREANNALTPFFCAVHKRRMKGVHEAYVVIPLWMLRMLAELAK